MNEKIWKLTDDTHGKTYHSTPTDVPVEWKRKAVSPGRLTYTSGPYRIERFPYGSKAIYSLFREGENLFGAYARLNDAIQEAVKNAEGRDRVHVA